MNTTTRTGWGLKAGDTVQRRGYGSTRYTVLNVFRGYYAGEGWLCTVRSPEGQQQTLCAGSLYTVENEAN